MFYSFQESTVSRAPKEDMEVGVIAETLADEGKTDLPPLPTQRGMCK
jgi:hypothetical protein